MSVLGFGVDSRVSGFGVKVLRFWNVESSEKKLRLIKYSRYVTGSRTCVFLAF